MNSNFTQQFMTLFKFPNVTIKKYYVYKKSETTINKYWHSCEISAHGLGGYMKAAFLIWSEMSSSSLNGKVPLTLKKKNDNNKVYGVSSRSIEQIGGLYDKNA